jgi:glycosyltransferase involved in cell wall biosynthesis
MRYRMFDIEVTGPVPSIELLEGDSGLALLVRRKGRPVAFWMEALPGPAILSSDDVGAKIGKRAGGKLLTERLRERLRIPDGREKPPSLSIVICTRDRANLLARCLDSLQHALAQSDPITWTEILVVDNASSGPETRRVVEERQGVRYLFEQMPGLDFARNRGLREAQGELVAYLDDDVVVDPGWGVGLQAAWRENPDAVGFTGLVLPYALETDAQVIFEDRGGFGRGFDRICYGSELPGNSLYPCGAGIFGAGANMAFRRDALLDLGGFDEALDTGPSLPGGGDLDIFYRMIRAGHRLVYEPSYCVFHEHRKEMKVLRRQYKGWGLGFMAFVGKSSAADTSQRGQFRKLILWWFKYQARELKKSLLKRSSLPPSMVIAELSGGLIGLFGEYSRSLRRTKAIRNSYA